MSAEIIPFPDKAKPKAGGYFGLCPRCGDNDGYLNIERCHWFYCGRHKMTWMAGENLFSSWHDETEADWGRNAQKLEGYREVESINPEPTESNRPRLCLKPNNAITNGPCAICGGRCDPAEYGLFLEGAWAPVCDVCGWQHEPALMFAIECVGFVEGLYTPTRSMPKRIHEEIERRLCNAPGGKIGLQLVGDYLDHLPF